MRRKQTVHENGLLKYSLFCDHTTLSCILLSENASEMESSNLIFIYLFNVYRRDSSVERQEFNKERIRKDMEAIMAEFKVLFGICMEGLRK
jgi:hypothetical protein